jgi:hypothetical protein
MLHYLAIFERYFMIGVNIWISNLVIWIRIRIRIGCTRPMTLSDKDRAEKFEGWKTINRFPKSKTIHFRSNQYSFKRIACLFLIVRKPLNVEAGLSLFLDASPASRRQDCPSSTTLQHQEDLYNHPSLTRSNSGSMWCPIIGDSTAW